MTSAGRRGSFKREEGFTLIELLVVILIIGILAAIAIPSFLNQTTKAYDASAKELARTAETTAETVATDNGGSYTNVTVANLHSYEATLATSAATAGSGNAFLLNAGPISGGSGFYVQTEAYHTGEIYQIVNSPTSGSIIRSCGALASQLSQTSPYTSSATGASGGCVNGSW